jgi:hypothetical protein
LIERDGDTGYVNVGTGYAFTALKAGVYRICYDCRVDNVGTAYVRATKNGSMISGSEITSTDYWYPIVKTLNVTLNANDVVRLQWRVSYSDAWVCIDWFVVSIQFDDLQTAFDTLIAVL